MNIALDEYEKLEDKLGIARCKFLAGQLFEHFRTSMFSNARQLLEHNNPSEWAKIKNQVTDVKINFDSKFEPYNDKDIDSNLQSLQSKLTSQVSELEKGLLFYQIGQLYEKKMTNFLHDALNIFKEINLVEAQLIINKYKS